MSGLLVAERSAAGGVPEGLLVLHHGRGSDEQDLLGLADRLDPARRLHVAAPRAPLTLEGSPGYHWYLVPRVGFPDPSSFESAREKLAELHDELWARTGLSAPRTVLGGFSMGAVMSYATALSVERPAPAGILAFSGFVPTVVRWQPSLADRVAVRAFLSHGRSDGVISVDFARGARALLQAGGLEVEYDEGDGGHQIGAATLPLARRWLADTLAAPVTRPARV